jgi:hypothetical protein
MHQPHVGSRQVALSPRLTYLLTPYQILRVGFSLDLWLICCFYYQTLPGVINSRFARSSIGASFEKSYQPLGC